MASSPSSAAPWTKSYPSGMRWDAELPIRPVQQILDDAVTRWSDRPALEFMGQVINYRALGSADTLTVGDLRGTHTSSVVTDAMSRSPNRGSPGPRVRTS